MALYNLTEVVKGNATLLSVTTGLNTHVVNGMLGAVVLLAIALVIFTAMISKTNDVMKSALGTSFITFSLSLAFLATGLIDDIAFYIILISLALLIAVSYRS